MKKFLLSIVTFAASLAAFGQSPVPASWNCGDIGTLPTGWSYNNAFGTSNNYSGPTSCDGDICLRLDATDDALTIFFGQQPGAISYQIGTTATTAWQGTLVLEESVDGVSWSNIHTYANGDIPASSNGCLNETYTPANSASRYMRFLFQEKISGYNLKLDEISIEAPVIEAATVRLTDVTNATILDGAVATPFNSTSVTYNILNDGTIGSLDVTAINLSGANQNAFAITSPALPIIIAPGASVPLVITFTANNGAGSYIADVSIVSNDEANSDYNFSIYGIDGLLASQPSGEITAGSATGQDLKTYRLIYNFEGTILNQDLIGGYLVLRSENGPVSTAPTDGTTYLRGQSIGNAKVVFAGRPDSDSPAIRTNWVQANKTYNFAVFSYGGSGVFTNYTSQINNVALTTPNTEVSPSEYAGISTSNPTFVTDLHNLINPHTSVFYSNYASIMINLFVVRDTFVTGGVTFDKVINCSYSGEAKLYNNPFDWTATGYSREHTYAHSWMPSFPADNPEKPEYSDFHNLYPTRQVNVNDLRCNYPFGEVVTVETGWPVVNPQGFIGLDANGNRVYEPKDEHKGRAARSLMYMAVCYTEGANVFSFNRSNGQQCLNFQIEYPQNQYLMKQWHFEHPPTGWDIARNDFLDSLQGNRNPFVDQPDYACFIDFSNLTKIATPTTPCWLDQTGIETIQNMNLNVFPNPSQGNIRVSWAGVSDQLTMDVYDISGKMVDSRKVNATNGVNIQDIQFNLPVGMYMLRLNGTKTSAVQRLIITE
jgi:endonuclease I